MYHFSEILKMTTLFSNMYSF